MKPFAIVYSSRTGNTKKIAEAMYAGREEQFDLFDVKDNPAVDGYEFIFMGYWIDRSAPDQEAKQFMSKLTNKKVVLFYTLGEETTSPHAIVCAANGGASLGTGCKVFGVFNSRGAIDPAVIERMKNMPLGGPHAATAENVARWASAAEHPNEEDLAGAKAFVDRMLAAYERYNKFRA